MNDPDRVEPSLDEAGFVRLISLTTVQIAGHFLEIECDVHGLVHRWRLLCGNCLACGLSQPVLRPERPRPGLPVDGAVRLPTVGRWPGVTLAWGAVVTHCDHPERLEPQLSRSASPTVCRHNRVLFRTLLPPRIREADPILVPGGLWIAVAPGHAVRVRSEAFGVRNDSRVASAPWQRCLS